MKTFFSYCWKIPLSGMAFFLGMMISGMLLPSLGLHAPDLPAGADQNTIAVLFMASSMILAFTLSFVSRGLSLSWVKRWFILFLLAWGVAAVGMVLESYFFMTTDAVASISNALFTVLNFLLPSLFLTGVVAIAFRPDHLPSRITYHNRSLADYGRVGFLWRIAVALAAYPVTYIAFGLLVLPFVGDYYSEAMFELVNPTWGQLIPLQLVRSLLFLLVCLPVILNWRSSRLRLWLGLGFSFFVLTAFMAVFTSHWFPWQLRFFHGLELLADGLVYAGMLSFLFGRPGTYEPVTNLQRASRPETSSGL